jgi:hypothetical protein
MSTFGVFVFKNKTSLIQVIQAFYARPAGLWNDWIVARADFEADSHFLKHRRDDLEPVHEVRSSQ